MCRVWQATDLIIVFQAIHLMAVSARNKQEISSTSVCSKFGLASSNLPHKKGIPRSGYQRREAKLDFTLTS